MKKNLGYADRIIRLIIAAIFITVYFIGDIEGTPGIILIALAAILTITSFIGSCPLYMPFGLNTLRKKLQN